MSAAVTGEVVERSDASIVELLSIAADLVEWVGGRVSYVAVGCSSVGVHVDSQADAEHLARILALGTVTDFPADADGHGFTVWSADGWPGPRFAVHCAAELVRPVRAFPPVEPWWLSLGDDGAEAA